MKNFKRKLAGLLVFAMVLGIMAPGVVAQAAEENTTPAEYSVKTDYGEELISFIYPASVGSIQYAEIKDGQTEDNVKSWEELEIGAVTRKKDGSVEASIDISWVKKKGSSLMFRFMDKETGESLHTETIKTPAQATSLKAAVIATATTDAISGTKIPVEVKEDMAIGDPETGYVVLYYAKEEAGAGVKQWQVVSPEAISWKKGTSGKWYSMDDLDLSKFKAKGATLYFHVNGTEDNWVSKDTKLSYKKQANAPKVKADVSKLTLGMKIGQEYQVQGSSNWINLEKDMELDAAGVKKLTIADLWSESSKPGTGTAVDLSDLAAGKTFTIKIRTAANTAKGTIPSKTLKLKLQGTSFAAIDPAITWSFDVEKDQLVFKNTSGKLYEYCFIDSKDTTELNTATMKWNKLKSDPTKTVGVKTSKVVDVRDKNKAADTLLVRVPGVKASRTTSESLASEWVSVSLADVLATKTTISGASIKEPATGFNIAYTEDTVAVSGASVSGNALKAVVEVDLANVSNGVKVGRITKPSGTKTFTATLEGSKLTVTIEYEDLKNAGAKAEVEIPIGTKTKIKFNFEATKVDTPAN